MSDTPERLRWPRRGRFRDRRRGIEVQGPNGTIPTDDLDDDDVDALLTRGFVPDEDDQDGSADDQDGSADDSDADDSDPDDLARWKDGFSGKYADVDPDDLDGESGTLPFNPESQSVSDIRDRLDDIDDAAAVRALANLEASQKDRSTAMDAFESRLNDLEAAGG